MIESVRAGTIFAHNQRAFSSWQRGRDRKAGHAVGLEGAGLEAAVAALARTNPEYVVAGP